MIFVAPFRTHIVLDWKSANHSGASLAMQKCSLTCIDTVELWTGRDIHTRTVRRYDGVVHDNNPPVDDQRSNSVYQFLEQKKVAKLDGYYGAPRQDESHRHQFLKFIGLIQEIRWKDKPWSTGFTRSHQVHFVDECEEQAHGTYQAGNAE